MLGKRSKIIAVESQASQLKELEARLSPHHQVLGTTSLERALPLLRAEPEVAAILVSTCRGTDVLSLLDAARRERPDVLRVLVTAFEDLTVVVEGLHSGAIQRVVSRPIEYAELLGVIRPAVEQGLLARSA